MQNETTPTVGDAVDLVTTYGEHIEATLIAIEDVAGTTVGYGGSPLPAGSIAYRFARRDGRSGKVGFRRYPHELVSMTPAR